MDEKPNTFAYRLGQVLGALLISCVAACVGCLMLALTIKFITFIF